MSSFTRRIQRSANRKYKYNGRGSALGRKNPKATDLLARLGREQLRKG